MGRTVGISRKVTEPLKVAVTAFVSTWIVTGEIHREATAVLAVAVIGAVFAYFAPAGEVDQGDVLLPDDFEPASEDVDETTSPQVVQPSQMADPDDRPTTVMPSP